MKQVPNNGPVVVVLHGEEGCTVTAAARTETEESDAAFVTGCIAEFEARFRATGERRSFAAAGAKVVLGYGEGGVLDLGDEARSMGHSSAGPAPLRDEP